MPGSDHEDRYYQIAILVMYARFLGFASQKAGYVLLPHIARTCQRQVCCLIVLRLTLYRVGCVRFGDCHSNMEKHCLALMLQSRRVESLVLMLL